MKTHIYIVRHGQTEWNVKHRMQGHQDSPLTDLGVEQAKWLGEALQNEPIDVIYASSSPRASRTAELIRADREIDIFETDDFKEINLGAWEGMTQDEIEVVYPDQMEYFWKDPGRFGVSGSETYQEVFNRAHKKLTEIVREHEGKTILIATHTVVVKLLMGYFEGRTLQKLWDLPYIHPACLCKVSYEGDSWEIQLHGDISHYKNTVQ
ncbi:histidine phosphatase family protein [Paenibacillus sp. D2_2]|uniref:histidine phosphatase family protein n=1 Tax=Paenibacillus sp. D2_2 TaxID=3073092 RepID=UPI002814FE01|nr:histidine phosphatase family protein [Paenibacillus sp. D2_2]WMT43012.1 histidine phosphatase family protein [Paenibacillus sp. D2_2]